MQRMLMLSQVLPLSYSLRTLPERRRRGSGLNGGGVVSGVINLESSGVRAGCTRRSSEESKTQTVLPSAEPLPCCSIRRVDGWQILATKPVDQPIDLAA
jgi:hypothetical protein